MILAFLFFLWKILASQGNIIIKKKNFILGNKKERFESSRTVPFGLYTIYNLDLHFADPSIAHEDWLIFSRKVPKYSSSAALRAATASSNFAKEPKFIVLPLNFNLARYLLDFFS